MTLKHYLLASLLFLSTVSSAFACAYCSMKEIQLGGMHPGSLTVAVALRRAADSGVIDGAALRAPSPGSTLHISSVGRLHAFKKAIAASPAAKNLPSSFSLGYVEIRLWNRYSRVDGKIRVDIHTDGPAEGEAVVLTGEPVITAVLAGELSVEHALAEKMIIIDGDKNEQVAIRRALEATSTAGKISRR
jgi:hypothetical protein